MEGGVVRTLEFSTFVKNGNPFFEFVDDFLGHIIEGGIFMHIKKISFDKLKMESKFDVHTFDGTCYAISIRQLQSAFYLLMLGYVLVVACIVIAIMWQCYKPKGRGRTITSLTGRH